MRSRIFALAAAGVVALAAPAIAVTVTPTNLNGWHTQNSGTSTGQFETGPGTPPAGTGSYELNVGADGNGAAQIRSRNQNGLALSAITSLTYSTYVDQDLTDPGLGRPDQAPYILLNLDLNGDTTVDDFLFFEPEYQNGGYNPAINQGTLALDTWQTWDAANGGWWSANGIGGAGPGTDIKTLSQYLAAAPNARIINGGGLPTGAGGLRLVAGFGAGAWDNFIGNVDNLTINGTNYNFEAAAPVPLPMAAWMGISLIGGTGLLRGVKGLRQAQA